MERFLELFSGLAMALAIIGIAVWHRRRARRFLADWAAENNLSILTAEYRHFLRGPFGIGTSRNQVVFFVVVRARDGTTREAWVCLGTPIAGLLSNDVQVQWD